MDPRNRLVLRVPPNQDYALPPAFPMPLTEIEGIGRRPFEFTLSNSLLQDFRLPTHTLIASSLWSTISSYCDASGEAMQGLEIYVVGDFDRLVVNLEYDTQQGWTRFRAEGQQWHDFCMASRLREGDMVGVWLFTHARFSGLWMAFLVTRLRLA